MAFIVFGNVRKWLEGISVPDKSDAWFTQTIVESDRWVRIKLAKWPPLLVEIVPGPVEDFTHALAEAAGTEASLRRAFSDQTVSAENSDRKMWQDIRDELLRELLDGELGVGPGAKMFETSASRANRLPVFGYGRWSEYIRSLTPPIDEGGFEVRGADYYDA